MNEQVCVIRVDGGICSQLAFVAYGIVAARPDIVVKYDLTWFRVCGLDVLREQVRNWDIPKLLPGLELTIATDEEVRLAREGRNGYRYVSGYPDRDPALLACANLFKPLMKPQLDPASARLLERIRNTSSCAIHVRRGDLAEGNSDYGRPTTLDYFKRAISFERSRAAGQADFYVFTDDADWCKENVMPLLAGGGGCLSENGADKGYIDLFLMAHCDAIVSSIGSLGVSAAVLSDKNPILYLSHVKKLAQGVENAVYFNDCFREGIGRSPTPKQYRRMGFYKIPYKLFRHLEKELRIE